MSVLAEAMDPRNPFYNNPIDPNPSNNNNNNEPLGLSPLPQDLMIDPPLNMSTYTGQPTHTMNPSSLWNSSIGGSALGSQPMGTSSSMINPSLGAPLTQGTTAMGMQPMANPINIYTGLPSQQMRLHNQSQGQIPYIQQQSTTPMLASADLHYQTTPSSGGASTPQGLRTNSYTSLASESPDKDKPLYESSEPIERPAKEEVPRQRGAKRMALELDGDVRSKYLERNRVAASKCRKKKKREVQNLVSQATELETKRDKLSTDLSQLLKQKTALKHYLMEHAGCGHPMIDAWIKTNAKDFVHGSSSNPCERESSGSTPSFDGSSNPVTPSTPSNPASIPGPGRLDSPTIKDEEINYDHMPDDLFK